MPEYLTVAEVAEHLRITKPSVYALIRAGELATFKIGRCRRIPAAAVDAYVRQQLEASGGSAAAALVARTTTAQGLPEQVADPAALARVAALVGTQPAMVDDDAA
jgi:excisionase family DNA binding protein